MDITLSISFPVIVPPAKFKFRYKLLPNGAYSSYTDQDNDPFTLTGLSAGQYEYEAIYVNPIGLECDPITGFFQVVEKDPCTDFTVLILYNDQSRPFIRIQYVLPLTPSPCGYLLTWTNNNTNQTGTIIILPLDPGGQMDFIFPNNFSVGDTFTILIQAQLCNGQLIDCFDDIVTPDTPTCTGIVVNSASMTTVGSGLSILAITLNITNSTPQTLNTIITYQQTNIISSGSLDAGSIPVTLTLGAGATGNISFNVQPNLTYAGNTITYSGSLTDICETAHTWNVSLAT